MGDLATGWKDEACSPRAEVRLPESQPFSGLFSMFPSSQRPSPPHPHPKFPNKSLPQNIALPTFPSLPPGILCSFVCTRSFYLKAKGFETNEMSLTTMKPSVGHSEIQIRGNRRNNSSPKLPVKTPRTSPDTLQQGKVPRPAASLLNWLILTPPRIPR